jgi:hypothetical protein
MSNVRYLIYVLKHPITKEVRYVGYTSKSLKSRLNYHYYELKKPGYSHRRHWLRSLPQRAIIEKIDECYDLETVLSKERFYISLYPNLVNSTSGGETNKVLCDEVRKRISQMMKGKLVGEKNPMFGKKRPDLKLRNLHNNPMGNLETRERNGKTLKAKYNTPEYLDIHCKAQKTRTAVVRKDVEGNILKTYPSIRKVEADGFGRKEVKKVCDGEHKQHKGYLWSYAVEKAV